MVEIVQWLQLAGAAAGALGGSLLFVEFFQLPNYVGYDPQLDSYTVDQSPSEVRQYTWLGRIGALLVALAFALQFVTVLL